MRKLTDIQYVGQCDTHTCLTAIKRYIHFGDRIISARLITGQGRHCFLLSLNERELVAVKSGFTSGYSGAGPNGLAMALTMLERHRARIDEIEVADNIIARIDSSSLRQVDLDSIQSQNPVMPYRWHDYIYDVDRSLRTDYSRIQIEFPATVPFGILDERLFDLGVCFFDDEDQAVLTAYRRLEDIVRNRTALNDKHGAQLFSKAFNGETPYLSWEVTDLGEQNGRAGLFTSTWMAYRNHRAHRESEKATHQALREFLLLNQLFKLESEASLRE